MDFFVEGCFFIGAPVCLTEPTTHECWFDTDGMRHSSPVPCSATAASYVLSQHGTARRA